MKLLQLVGATLAGLSCSGDITGSLEPGTWGGAGIYLQAMSNAAQLEFDCATGSIPGALELSAGKFSAAGTVTLDHGGPIRQGETPDVRAATFTGSVSGDHMTITVAIAGPNPTSTTYQLLRRAPPVLHKCL